VSGLRVLQTSRSKSRIYLERGTSLLAVLSLAEQAKNRDGMVVNAIQSSIAFAYAYTIAKLGLRCRGQDHSEVLALITSIKTPESARLTVLLQRILDQRSALYYGDQPVSSELAARVVRLAKSVGDLVRSAVG
jgi:hypothetical protein